MDFRLVHQIHVYMGDNLKIISTITKQSNTTIGTLNDNVVQENGADSQENPINNNNLSKRIWSEREK